MSISKKILWTPPGKMFFIASFAEWHIINGGLFWCLSDLNVYRLNYFWLLDRLGQKEDVFISQVLESYKNDINILEGCTFNSATNLPKFEGDRIILETDDILVEKSNPSTLPCFPHCTWFLKNGTIIDEYSMNSIMDLMIIIRELGKQRTGNAFLDNTEKTISILVNTANQLLS